MPSKARPLWQRYEKPMPGYHVQVDVKFLNFSDRAGKPVRRFQYTAIDEATRIRALKVYDKHTQENGIDFVSYVVAKFPLRNSTIRTDNGHQFQVKFHWHVEDLGIEHQYINVRAPRLKGKVQRSHRTDKEEFYQLLSDTEDVNLNLKLEEWQNFYNYHRPRERIEWQKAGRTGTRKNEFELSCGAGRMIISSAEVLGHTGKLTSLRQNLSRNRIYNLN